MIYEQLPKITKEEAEAKLKVTYGEELCLLLLSIYEIEDWKWVQDTYIHYVTNEDKWVASAAITGLGHLARITDELENGKVLDVLEGVSSSNPELEGKVSDAINDINMFSKSSSS
ncbi:MAG: hypothetical protein L3J59_13400 [Methylococcaceae bacterium]|nr:hypothetical protein [Methylococcaceae bacterium]